VYQNARDQHINRLSVQLVFLENKNINNINPLSAVVSDSYI